MYAASVQNIYSLAIRQSVTDCPTVHERHRLATYATIIAQLYTYIVLASYGTALHADDSDPAKSRHKVVDVTMWPGLPVEHCKYLQP